MRFPVIKRCDLAPFEIPFTVETTWFFNLLKAFPDGFNIQDPNNYTTTSCFKHGWKMPTFLEILPAINLHLERLVQYLQVCSHGFSMVFASNRHLCWKASQYSHWFSCWIFASRLLSGRWIPENPGWSDDVFSIVFWMSKLILSVQRGLPWLLPPRSHGGCRRWNHRWLERLFVSCQQLGARVFTEKRQWGVMSFN